MSAGWSQILPDTPRALYGWTFVTNPNSNFDHHHLARRATWSGSASKLSTLPGNMNTSSTVAPIAKKRKLSQEPGTEPPAVQSPTERSSKFWFDDGNVVLQTSRTMFRVHKSILKLHSNVFEDMFAVPQPDDEPTIEGCPFVQLTDAEEDWEVLLGILYHTRARYIQDTNVICTTDMLAILRLGQKYDFEYFKEEALAQLRQIFPRTIKELDVILDRSPSRSTILDQLQLVPNDDEFKILKTIIDLHIETVLPMAYYFCVRNRTLADIFRGRDVSRTDDDTDYLSAETKAALVIGKEKLSLEYPDLTFSWWCKGKPSASCARPKLCKLNAYTIASTLAGDTGGIELALDPPVEYDGFCSQCELESKAAHDAGRQALMKALPSYFGLPPWDELKDF